MRVSTALLSLGLLVCVQVSAQMGMGMGMGMGAAARRMPQVDQETLIMTRIDNWAPTPARRSENKIDVFVFPEGEDSSNWTEAFQQEVYDSTQGMESARHVYDLRLSGDRENCPNYTSEVRKEEPDNGYSSIVWRQSCEPAPGSTFASLHKIILGNDRLYILTKIWKEEPSGRDWRRWENLLEDVYVCDPAHADHPCRAL